ncbi:MAG: glycosyltransferase family 4 protein [Patescibacteria group bacterium]|nr:glycosyltransferase family 4 protein [Patescibacteria group bacterium]
MKIAQIVCVYPPYKGGIGTSALETARVLSSAHHEVKTFTINYKSPLERGGSAPGGDGVCYSGGQGEVIRLKAFPKIGNGGFLPQLFWRLQNFDLVFLHYPFFGAAEIVWLLKKFVWHNKTRLVVHFHMEPEFSSPLLKILSWPSRLIMPSLFKQADLIVCASRDYAEANMPREIWAASQDKIKEIPFSVDAERFKPAAPPESASPYLEPEEKENIFKILFVGGLDKAHYFKGIDILLDALSLLDKDRENWQMEIVGGGDCQTQYENRARELGLSDKVIFAGLVSDEELPKKYQAADCFVLPSVNKGEAFGIVLLEAMASGLPVIASNLPGVRQVFINGQEGMLVRPGNAYDLKGKMEFLMENSERRVEMGRAARKLAEEKYSLEKISNKLISELVN